jgi:hypothetical protein
MGEFPHTDHGQVPQSLSGAAESHSSELFILQTKFFPAIQWEFPDLSNCSGARILATVNDFTSGNNLDRVSLNGGDQGR